MTIVLFGLAALIVLLMAAALAVPIARRLGLPVAVLMAALGVTHGVATSVLEIRVFSGALDAYDQWFVAQLALDSQSLLYLFLPPLLFEMTLAVNVRRLLEDAVAVMTMAILAVFAATAIIGGSLWVATPIGIIACLILGAAVATTDPGAVISTFREIGAPRRLLVILEGESLLNDAAAIAIFGLLLGVLRHQMEPSVARVATDFLYSFGAGAAVGLAVATVAGQFYRLLERSSAAEMSVTVAVAYGSFIAAEQAFGGSGVVAVVFAGLATGSAGFLRMGPGNWMTVRAVWAQIGFWSNALIMILATSLVPGLIEEVGWRILPLTALVYVGATAARAAIIFGVLPLLARLKLTTALTRPQGYLVVWGGVRGSVTLVLAISIADVSDLGSDARLLAALAASYTLTTIFLNAGTLAWLTGRLGLNRLSPTDLALREKIVAGALERVRNVVGNLVRARHLEPEALAAVERALGARRSEVEAHAATERVPFGERIRMGLTIVSGQETRLIRRAFEEGAIGPRAANVLRLDADRISDGVRVDGREGYRKAAFEAIQPATAFKFAVQLRRFLRLDRPLRAAMELHFVRLLESERIVRELRGFVEGTVAPMIGADAAENVTVLLEARHRAISAEIDALAAQYPIYARTIERTLITRAAIRRERQQYWRLLNDGVIGQELYDSLTGDLDRRERVAARPPRIDLTLTPYDLLNRVPIFAGLEPKQRRMVARAMRTRFATPGEVIREAGARGTEMYFIASGVVEMIGADGTTRLGSGEAFGEAALLEPLRRRRRQVRSLGYSRLLVLKRRDLVRLMEKDPSIDEAWRAATAEAADEPAEAAS